MRWIRRVELPTRASSYLARKQAEVDAQSPPLTPPQLDRKWKGARSTKTVRDGVVRVLKGMAGPRARCMYCSDSRGATIEHFRPKSSYPEHAFRWPNFLWICGDCNTHKNAQFPVGAAGAALIIDPTLDDPWEHLFFDSSTGEITACYLADGSRDEKGKHTIQAISPLRDQAVTEGRLRAWRNIVRVVEGALESPPESVVALIDAIGDVDGYGLARWSFHCGGRDEQPFRRFREEQPDAWEAVARSLAG